jgi:E3 ubiquitin-protein ligase HUWE1
VWKPTRFVSFDHGLHKLTSRQFGINRIVPLKDGGEHLPVTQENKREFVQSSAQYRLYSSINHQIESLSGGLYEIVPKDLIAIVRFP